MKLGNYIKKLINSYRRNKREFAFYLVLRAMVIVTCIRCLITKNYESAAICILSLILFLIPAFLEDVLDLTIPPFFEAIIFAFIFAAEILGEINHYYVKIPGWDTILHTLNGFLFAAVGFSLIYLLNRGSKHFNVSPFYMAVVAFCFSMTIGVLWEFFECGMDLFLHLDMQKDFIVQSFQSTKLDPAGTQQAFRAADIVKTQIYTASGEVLEISDGYLDIGILDTMKDLLVNFIGAVVFCVFGFIYLRAEDKGKKAKVSATIVDGLKIQPVRESLEEDRGNQN